MGSTDTMAISEVSANTLDNVSAHTIGSVSQNPSCRAMCGSLASFDACSVITEACRCGVRTFLNLRAFSIHTSCTRNGIQSLDNRNSVPICCYYTSRILYKMEGIAAEVSQKLKSAIKAKLMELGAYVDEELPNYVMVMVTNRRSKAEMDRELNLFLGGNTATFTTWLQSVWTKLEQVTVANLEKKKPIDKKKKIKKIHQKFV
ncbi:hypothetical protein U1Q18_047496 [Sarracenia purpurea var. burkii]